MDYRTEAPEILRRFLTYHQSIRGHSQKTVDEYFLDLRTFFRFIKLDKGLVPKDTDFESISILDVDLDFIKKITLTDVYNYLDFLSRDRLKHPGSASAAKGLSASSRARKVATIRSFYKYLVTKAQLLSENPVADLDSPKVMKGLPHYLSLDESVQLLSSVSGPYQERDYCILMLFLNCGLRISELVNLNISDIHADHIRVLGKGNKERMVYLNEATAQAINAWLPLRKDFPSLDKNALFVTQQHRRISTATVHHMVKKYLSAAGLDSSQYSAHKLRHTAATLMLKNGVDVRTLQELLGHEHLNTTQIYTHVDNSELRIAAKANPLGHFDPSKPENTKE